MGLRRHPLIRLTFIILLPLVCSCSSAETKPEEGGAGRASSSEEVQKLLTQLDSRIQALEAKLTSLNDKLDATRLNLDQLANNQKTKNTEIIAHPSQDFGIPVPVPAAPHDPEAGFVNDETVQGFRKAMILFQGQKYPESVLAFSEFLERFPDHALAGSAQYYVAEAYFKQREYKLAIQEFQRVLTSYDRSAHISDTLRDLAIAEENLKQTQDAAKHRQLLSSLFPQSPAAKVHTEPQQPESAVAQEKSEASETAPQENAASQVQPPAPLTAPIEDSEKIETTQSHPEFPTPSTE